MRHIHCQTVGRAQLPTKNSHTCSGQHNNVSFQGGAVTVHNKLDEFLNSHPLPGLQLDQSRKRFVQLLCESWAQHSLVSSLYTQKFDSYAEPNSNSFHPVLGILENYQKGERDEAIWLAFLSIHFGLELNTIRLFYGKFGQGCWDWKTVVKNPDQIRVFLQRNHGQLGLLKFGNHRKYESNDPDKLIGTPNVIRSFVRWVIDNGTSSPYDAFLKQVSRAISYEDAFDRLYRNLRVIRFGRTAKFDLLALFGNLNILAVKPGHCYLRGATGPSYGAKLMVTGRRKGNLSHNVEQVIMALQNHLGPPANVLEDALCNWQKKSI
jgi:hypothetical protein